MELHENLYALGLRLGREVFSDPDSFRGALDDFLDEESATTGDINLLVDAVRLGAFQSMTSMIDSGAQVTAAVEEAGNRLARDRGSADVAGGQWACAVLGFAIGKVSDAEVRRYRTQHATPQPPSMPLPPTQLPAQQSPPTQARQPAPPPAAPTQYPGSGPLPTQQPQAFAQGPMPTPPGSVPPPSSWPGPGGSGPMPPEPKRRTWPILVATVVAIALIAGGIVALIVTRDSGDDGNGPSDDTSEKTDELALDLDSIKDRYGTLAGDVTTDLDDDCEAGEAAEGTSEVVTCSFADGTLELTTYSSKEDLDSARTANTGTDAGTRFSQTDAGVVYGVDAGSAVSEADVSSIYWDSNEGLESGKFTLSSDSQEDLTMDDLAATFTGTDPVVPWPTKPEDQGMTELATEFVSLPKCDRIQTIQDGELEESICTAPKGITVFMGVFKSGADFKAYRRDALQQGADQGYPLRNWNFGGGAREGAAAEYYNSSGDAVRYWDKPECKCYMEANLTGGDLKTLENWWVNA